MAVTDYVGGFYGAEIVSIATHETYWWNGSAWVLGRLPTNLRSGMDLCVARMRVAQDTPANLRGSSRKTKPPKPGKSHRIG